MGAPMNRREILFGAASMLAIRQAAAQGSIISLNPSFASGASSSSQWYNLPIGGAGYHVKLRVQPSGMMVVGSDVCTPVVGSTVLHTIWERLVTGSSQPSAYNGTPFSVSGTYDVCIDPSNDNHMLLFVGSPGGSLATVWQTTNKGSSWSLTNFGFTSDNSNSSDGSRINNQRMQIDPNNSNVAYVGNGTGLYVCQNLNLGTSATWTHISAVPAPTSDAGICGIQVDPNSGTTGGVTNRVIVGSNGNGIYVTADAGSTWSLVSGSSTSIGHGYLGSDGTYYSTLANNTTGNISRVTTSNVVTTLTSTSAAVMINPANPAQAIGIAGPNLIFLNGAINSGTPTSTANFSVATVATDCPWLQNDNVGISSLGEASWDPLVTTSATSLTIGSGTQSLTVGINQSIAVNDYLRVSNTGTPANYMLGKVTAYTPSTGALTLSVGSYNEGSGYLRAATGGSGTFSAWTINKERLWATGAGIFYCDLPQATATNTWVSQTSGSENIGANGAVWASGGNLMVMTQDRPWWAVTQNPVGTTGLPTYGPNHVVSIVEGGHVDVSKTDPTYWIGGTAQPFAGVSTDGGVTWGNFSSTPSAHGFVACSSTTNSVFAPIGSGTWYYTTNGGSSWTACSGNPNGLPKSVATLYWATSPICADQVTAGTFYAYANSTFYSSTDNGATWSAKASLSSNNYLVKLKSVQGNAGHVFFSAGNQQDVTSYTSLATIVSSHPASQPFYFSSNGCATFTALPNVNEVIDFGICAAKPGGNGYPSIGFIGWMSGVYGIWRIDNFDPTNIPGTTYVNIGTYPNGSTSVPSSMAGDPNNWNWFVTGTSGEAFQFYGGAIGWP